MECRRIRRQRLAAQTKNDAAPTAPQGFDAADLGQGAKGGGTAWQWKKRLDLCARVRRRFPCLLRSIANDMERAFRLWDTSLARQHLADWGHMMRNEIARMLASADKGDSGAPHLVANAF